MAMVAGLAVVALGGCVESIKENRVEVALRNAGVSQPVSECAARRMAAKLSIAQLRRLQALGVQKRSYYDYIVAVKKVHDPDALEVMVASLALCKAGIVR